MLVDGNEAEVFYTGAKSIMYIKTSVGICGVFPFNPDDAEETKIVITTE